MSDHPSGTPGRGRFADSLWEYAGQVASQWPWLLLGGVAIAIGLYRVAFSPILGLRTWIWFAAGFALWSVAQFLAFHSVRAQRNDVLRGPASDKVSMYAVAASRGRVPPPVVAPVEYQLHALRQALAFLQAQQRRDVDVATLDSILQRLERDGVELVYEPLSAADCEEGLHRLVATGELIDQPELHGFSYRLPPYAQAG
jgi:hypothetical protein